MMNLTKLLFSRQTQDYFQKIIQHQIKTHIRNDWFHTEVESIPAAIALTADYGGLQRSHRGSWVCLFKEPAFSAN